MLHTGEWVTAAFRPGQTPFNALAMALYELESPDRQPSVDDLDNRAVQIRERGLAAQVSKSSVLLKGKRILLHVDQFEEIFTARSDGRLDGEQAVFLDQILSFGDTDNAACRLVCTLRADFLGQMLTYPDLGRRLQGRLLTISPMGTEALERAVTEPALACDVTYEAGLAQQIARDASGGDGGLPLMQFALTELWPRQRQRRRLTFAQYHEFGRVGGALDRYAEIVFVELEPRWSEERIRRVMLACVRSRSGAMLATRCTVRKDFTGVAFSPDGHTLASGSFDGTVRLWDLTDPHHLAIILTGHTKEVEAVAFTPEERTLASGGSDGAIRLWDTNPEEATKDICELIVTPSPVFNGAVHP